MIRTIDDIYKYQKAIPAPMLSDYNADFWSGYMNSYPEFDRLFRNMYKSWFPIDQDGDLADVSENFAADVESWLTINNKRYSELYRLQTIPDNDKYSLTDNVYETETINKVSSASGQRVKGTETITDEASNQYGAKSSTDSRENVYGQQVVGVEGTVINGAGSKETVNSTSAYNESGYTPTDKTEETEASRTETTDMDTTHGSHTDTESLRRSETSHTDVLSNTRTDGSRTDTSADEGTEKVTRERSGNIGVKTVDQMLGDHKDFWVDFSFYKLIFEEIARELMRGVI